MTGALYPGDITIDGVGVPLSLAEMTPTGLLIIFIATVLLGIFTGRLVVKMHYDAAVKRAEAAEATVATLTATNTTLTANNAKLAEAIIQTGAVGDSMEKLINGLQQARERAVESS